MRRSSASVRSRRLSKPAGSGSSPSRAPRAEQDPDPPSIAEALPGYDSRGWFGYVAPAGTPKRIVDALNAEINRAMMTPDVKEKLEAIGLTVVAESPAQFAQVLKTDYEKYGKLIKAINFQPQ